MEEEARPERGQRQRVLAATLAAGLLFLVVWWQAGAWYADRLLTEQRASAAVEVSLRGNLLSSLLTRRVARLQGLAAYVQSQSEERALSRAFEEFARALLRNTTAIRSITIAPEGVVRYVFPPAAGTSQLGQLLEETGTGDIREVLLEARQTGEVIFSQPEELLSGSQAVTAYQAVLVDGQLWGYVSLTVDFAVLLQEGGLGDDLAGEELSFALRDSDGQVFFGAEELFEQDPVVNLIQLPDAVWELAGAPAEGWPATLQPELRLFRIAGLVIVLLMTGLVYLTLSRQTTLSAAVQARTTELREVNLQLAADIVRREELERELRLREEDLEQRVAYRTQELRSLLDTARNVAMTLELEPLLEKILDQLQVLVDYTGASVMLLQDDRLVNLANRGPLPAVLGDMGGVSVKELQSNLGLPSILEPLILSDSPGRLAPGPLGSENEATEVRAWLAVPLLIKDAPIGAIVLYHVERGYYDSHDGDLVQGFADQAAVAVENARLYEQTRRLAILQERQRLARDLHDSVSQALYGIVLGARTARRVLDSEPQRAAEPVEYVLSLAEAGLAEMRALIFELRPETLEHEGLVAALRRQASSVQARHKLQVETEFGDEPELSLDAKEALYRIAQEALNNVVKHAGANAVQIRLVQEGTQTVLDVRDNGRGFDPTQYFPGRLGLRSMAERVLQLGGTLDIDSSPGGGTQVRAVVPRPEAGGSRSTKNGQGEGAAQAEQRANSS